MKEIILDTLDGSVRVKQASIRSQTDRIIRGAERIAAALADGNKLLIFGNGGSAADAQHLAAEFVNRFRVERPPLAALALTTDTSILTAIGNDYHFEVVFEKQIRALGRRGDVAVGISTSGNSPNVVNGVRTAGEMGLFTIGLTGPGGELAHLADLVFTVDSPVTARIQETHITLGHILCDLVDRILYPDRFPADAQA